MKTPDSALNGMRNRKGCYVPELLHALQKTHTHRPEISVQRLRLTDLREGMVLCDDIVAEGGLKVAVKGSELSIELITLLRRFFKNRKVKEPISVRGPGH